MKLTEKQIETQILTYLAMANGCVFFKHNNTGIFDPKTKRFRTVQNKFIPKGASDIYGSFYGRAVYIEVKTPEEHAYIVKHYDEIKRYVKPALLPGEKKKTDKKEHIKNQINFLELARKNHCIAFFACNLEQVKDALSKVETSR